MIDLSLRYVQNSEGCEFGPQVVLVRVTVEGIIVREKLPVIVAKILLLQDPLNGIVYRSGRIIFDTVLDEW